MKIVIFGDTHDNIANIKHVMGYAKKIKAEAIIHTGDWSSLKTYEVVKSYGIKIYGVLGNADIDPKLIRKLKIKAEKFAEDFLKFKIGGVKIGVVHRFTKEKQQDDKDCSVVFTGHYHSQKEWEVDGIKVIRPGALENGINFAIFDTKTKMVEFINHDKLRRTSQT